jgi:DNA processing protein
MSDAASQEAAIDATGEQAASDAASQESAIEAVYREDPRFPAMLASTPGAPRVLYVAGGARRLGHLLSEPAVAIVGSRRATDYGMETARGLARGLAASGVTVLGALAGGIAAAAHMGALDARGPTVTVMSGGVDICQPASHRSLYERLREQGCAVSEVPCGRRPPRRSHMTHMRILVGMAHMVIVVEAEDSPAALAPAHIAQTFGRTVAAVPGRVSSPVSAGPHALLTQGARLVRGPQDALDVLYGVGAVVAMGTPLQKTSPAKIPLAPPLQAVLEQVSSGRDTLAKLTAAASADIEQTTVALAELELMGALVRGDGGRYIPRL